MSCVCSGDCYCNKCGFIKLIDGGKGQKGFCQCIFKENKINKEKIIRYIEIW